MVEIEQDLSRLGLPQQKLEPVLKGEGVVQTGINAQFDRLWQDKIAELRLREQQLFDH